MHEELYNWWGQMRDAVGREQRELFVRYCGRLVQLKEEGKLSEEEAAYRMVGCIQFTNLTDSPECNEILEIAGMTELPRTSSYAQPKGKWNEETANQIKQKEWQELVTAVGSAKQFFGV